MDHNFVTLATFCIYFLLFLSPHVVHGTNNNNTSTISPCSKTPYPHVCNHYIVNDFKNYLPSTLDNQNHVDLSFRDLALKVTMEQAIEAHRLVAAVDSNSFDERGKSAWQDCLELYKDTVDLLNRSIVSSNNKKNKNPLDTLTWLSASFANHQTCQNGFTDFKLTSSHFQSFPPMLTNFSKLLSNSLAIQRSVTAKTTSFRKQNIHGRRLLSDESSWPEWLSATTRKLLRSRTAATKASDIVVAQDGSGNYKTISEAVEAAAKLGGGSKRIVIHVKSGVYKENVEIKKEIKNLMVIGDGIDATIVTGNRNQHGGSTTFRSATFGEY